MPSLRTAAIARIATALEAMAAGLGPGRQEMPGDIQLLLAEYTSLREEVRQALQTQQQILTWSLATLGVFFAGGAAVATSNNAVGPQGLRGLPFILFCLIFGVALPGAITAAAAAWLGELARMERVNNYIRGLEILVAEHYKVTATGNHRTPGIFRWETYLAARTSPGSSNAKRRIGYLGAAALYGGAFVVSLVTVMVGIHGHTFKSGGPDYHQWSWWVAGALFVIFIACTAIPGFGILGMSGKGPLELEKYNPRR